MGLFPSQLGNDIVISLSLESKLIYFEKSSKSYIPLPVYFYLRLIFPFFPDDILCIVAGLIKMRFRFFLLAVFICRTISIAVICFLGTGELIPFSGIGIPLWIALFAFTVLCAYLLNRV